MADPLVAEVAALLYGDGADELIAKLDPGPSDLATKDRRKRKFTAGLSAIGASAGALGLAVGAKEVKTHGWSKTPKMTRALIPAEIAGLGGELMATKILHGDTKKKLVAKSITVPNPKKMATKKALDAAESKKGCLKQLPKKAMAQYYEKSVSKSDEVDVRWEGEFSKVNADKQQVFGWASIVELNGEPVVDLQGDYIAIDEVEKSAYEYVHKSRKGGDMHLRDGDQPVHKSDMIESFVVTPEKKAALGLPESTPTGWWVGYQINDPELWGKVKSGERTGFSIHGRGVRTDA